jgi:hypothetical protein
VELTNNLTEILKILEKYNFNVNVNQQNADLIWPGSVKKWAKKQKPQLYRIIAVKNS